jgi:hypothetical protein
VSKDCGTCPSLQAQVNQLRVEVSQLRVRLFQLRGETEATVKFIDQEQLEPTLPRRRFVPTIRGRLAAAVANVDER